MCVICSPQTHLRMAKTPRHLHFIVWSKPDAYVCEIRSWPAPNNEIYKLRFVWCAQSKYAAGELINHFCFYLCYKHILFTPCTLTQTRTICTTPARKCDLRNVGATGQKILKPSGDDPTPDEKWPELIPGKRTRPRFRKTSRRTRCIPGETSGCYRKNKARRRDGDAGRLQCIDGGQSG